MRVYKDDGYPDIEHIFNTLTRLGIYFLMMVGPRGTGKTYGWFKFLNEQNIMYMLMRRMQSETDLINKPQLSPYKQLNEDEGWRLEPAPISKYNSGIYDNTEEDVGAPVAYTCALSTVANMRGFDAHDIKVLMYDEFIPEAHARPIKKEASALFNAYETMNRNRELVGEEPLFLCALANSNDLANPLFMELGLVKAISTLRKKGQEVYINRDKGVCVILMDKSPKADEKSDTFLYKVTKGTEFSNMAINNSFNREEASKIKPRPIKEYFPVVKVGELCIYEHKFNGTFYATLHQSGKFATYGIGDLEKTRFINHYRWIWREHLYNNIIFEDELCEILLTRAFK